MSKSRQELILYIRKVEDQLKALYGNTYAEVLKLATVRSAIESGAQFTWKGNPLAERQLNQQLELLSNRASKAIYNGITGGWKEGESQVKDEILERFGKKDYTKEVNNVMEDAVKQQRKAGVTAHTFANEKRGGLNVSGRVWNLAGNAKKDLEVIIQNGILEGKSADEVTRGLKDYLNEPDRLYRRVKNKETGEMELSSAAKQYNPGRGVYRSAYKNALRLAITEINAAYRRAEWESYQNNPLIVGYRIELSNNHTVVINGKVRTLYDICDDMAGVYPKTFLWTGWHPHCRCRMIPIMISDEDFKARQKARQAGKLDEWKPQRTIKEPPKAFFDWIENNRERAKGWGNMPFFVKDNFKGGLLSNGLKELKYANNNIPNLVYPKESITFETSNNKNPAATELSGKFKMATTKQIFNEIDGLNPQTSTISSLGSYVSQSSKMVSDSIYKEVLGFLPKDSLAYKILTSSERYTEKQLWVISYELERNAEFNKMVSERISIREAKSNAKLAASKSKLQANKAASQSILDYIKANGKKLADYYKFVKKNKKYSREFYSKKFTIESANEFLAK